MRLWFAGAEVSAWRNLLADQQIPDVAMSYVGLSRKVKFAKPWLIAEHFNAAQHVLLDSGAYSINNAPKVLDPTELVELTGKYEDFVGYNLDAVDYVLEMDALAMGPAMLRNHRATLGDIAGDKAVAVWHPQDGLAELMLMSQRHRNIAIGAVELEGRDLTPTLVSLANDGIKLFGLAMTKPAVMAAIPWYSVHSTSWLSPSQYGDTVMWSRGELKRYHSRQKDTARRRHRTEIELAGFDPQLVIEDDMAEVLKVSLWSWTQQLAALNTATISPETPSYANAESDGEHVDIPLPGSGNGVATSAPRQRPMQPLPGVAVELLKSEHKDENGVREVRELPLLRTTSGSMRPCDTCVVKDVCKKMDLGYEPGAYCKYDVPVDLSTEEQLDALLRLLIEHETSDYLRERWEEELMGGGDHSRTVRGRSNISRLIKLRSDLNTSGFTIKVTGRGPSSDRAPGFLSQMFGPAPQAIAPAPSPLPVYEQLGVLDAEVVGEQVE
jgi:hypothetical protein